MGQGDNQGNNTNTGASRPNSTMLTSTSRGKEAVKISQRTLFSEYDSIDIAIQIIDLVQILHDKDIIHTNLNPDNIFLCDEDTNKMCFQNLHHCSWNPTQVLGIDDLGPEFEDNLSLYDLRTRNMNFASPEQLELNNELASIVMKKNGKIVENSYEI